MESKICKTCRIEKNLNDYRKGHLKCKKCEYTKRKISNQIWYQRNKERLKAKSKEYHKTNVLVIKAKKKLYRQRTKNARSVKMKLFYKKNKMSLINKSKKYYKENEQKVTISNKKRSKNHIKNLTDWYVKKLLKDNLIPINDDSIKLKRLQVKGIRLIKNITLNAK